MNMTVTGIIRTFHEQPECIAGSLKADNLTQMETRATQDCVETTIEGQKIRSIIASVDDYLMNLAIAEEICSFVSH